MHKSAWSAAQGPGTGDPQPGVRPVFNAELPHSRSIVSLLDMITRGVAEGYRLAVVCGILFNVRMKYPRRRAASRESLFCVVEDSGG